MIELAVRVIPRSSKPGIAGVRDGALLIRLQSPPVKGAANSELIKVIAKAFGVRKLDVAIVAGERSKLKRLSVAIDAARRDSVLRSVGVNPDELAS